MKVTSYNWVKSFLQQEDIEHAKLEASFKNAATFRLVLIEHIKRELSVLDKKSTFEKLVDKPNRAELLLAYAAKRESLNNLMELLID